MMFARPASAPRWRRTGFVHSPSFDQPVHIFRDKLRIFEGVGLSVSLCWIHNGVALSWIWSKSKARPSALAPLFVRDAETAESKSITNQCHILTRHHIRIGRTISPNQRVDRLKLLFLPYQLPDFSTVHTSATRFAFVISK